MTDLKAELDALVQDVNNQRDVVASAMTLVQGLEAQLTAALNKPDSNESDLEGDITQIRDGLRANTQTLATGLVSQGVANPAVNPQTQAGPSVGTEANPIVIDAPDTPSRVPAPANAPDLNTAPPPDVNTPGSAGDTTTGSVASAGASPPPPADSSPSSAG